MGHDCDAASANLSEAGDDTVRGALVAMERIGRDRMQTDLCEASVVDQMVDPFPGVQNPFRLAFGEASRGAHRPHLRASRLELLHAFVV